MLDNIHTRMEMATGICHKTIQKLLAPSEPRERKQSSTKINIDDFDRQAIIRKVHEFYQRREFPIPWINFWLSFVQI